MQHPVCAFPHHFFREWRKELKIKHDEYTPNIKMLVHLLQEIMLSRLCLVVKDLV